MANMGIRKTCQKSENIPRGTMQRSIKTHPKAIQNPSKIQHNGAQACSEDDLEQGSARGPPKASALHVFLEGSGFNWLIL